jgi:hypothetical protein
MLQQLHIAIHILLQYIADLNSSLLVFPCIPDGISARAQNQTHTHVYKRNVHVYACFVFVCAFQTWTQLCALETIR